VLTPVVIVIVIIIIFTLPALASSPTAPVPQI
jgi:hypothetical protein